MVWLYGTIHGLLKYPVCPGASYETNNELDIIHFRSQSGNTRNCRAFFLYINRLFSIIAGNSAQYTLLIFQHPLGKLFHNNMCFNNEGLENVQGGSLWNFNWILGVFEFV